MKRFFAISVCVLLAVCLITSFSFAAEKREKFGVDKRSDMAKRVKFKPSTEEKVRWKMVMPWSKGLLFYDFAPLLPTPSNWLPEGASTSRCTPRANWWAHGEL